MKKILFYLTLLPICALQAQNDMNIATTPGVWDACATWGNPIAIYNSTAQPKTINNGVTVTLNKTEVYAKKITFEGNGKINFNNTANKITFSPAGGYANTPLKTCNATGAGGKTIIDNVTVDFAQSVTAKSMSGFIHGLYNKDPFRPSDTDITPLRPKLFRVVYPDLYDRAYGLSGSGRIHYLPSDRYTNFYFYKFVPVGQTDTIYIENPGQIINSVQYDAHLNTIFDWGNGKPGIVWECWNEPNNETFWFNQNTPNQNEFFATYKQFYTKLRNKLGSNALAAGPSIDKFDVQYFHAFFDYCLENNLEVNVVTWHELINYNPISLVQDNVDYVRKNFMNNPKYAKLKIQSIEINEIVDCGNRNNPVGVASYLGNLEKAGVDYAAKSCWCEQNPCFPNDCKADNGCYTKSLNHLFHPDSGAKKAGYWVYENYAKGVPTRVQSVNEEGHSIVIANKDNVPDTVPARIIFGYTDMSDASGLYNFKLQNINSILSLTGTSRSIWIYKIPNPATWSQTLPARQFVSQTPINSSNDRNFSFEAERDHLYVLEISSP